MTTPYQRLLGKLADVEARFERGQRRQHVDETQRTLDRVRKLRPAAQAAVRQDWWANDPEGVRRRTLEREAQAMRDAEAIAEKESIQDQWSRWRAQKQPEVERARAAAISSGRVTDFSALPPDLPITAPSYFGQVDTGVPRLHKPDITDDRNPDGTRTITFDVDPITRRKLNAAPALPTPEEQFRAAAAQENS